MPFLSTMIAHPSEDDSMTSPEGKRIEATTLGEAVAVAEQMLGVRIIPHEPPKWFRVYGIPESRSEYSLVDIHIRRGKQEICAKQDMSIPLLDGDIVSIGLLAC